MKVEIHAAHIDLTDALRAHVERRLDLALGRFAKHIRSVTVRLSDTHGPRGGSDMRCGLAVGMRRAVRVEETDTDILTAVDRAANHASSCVTRALKRERALTNSSIHFTNGL
jgi:putative sigma-54 modulation protein